MKLQPYVDSWSVAMYWWGHLFESAYSTRRLRNSKPKSFYRAGIRTIYDKKREPL